MNSLQSAIVTFEDLAPADLPSALGSLPRLQYHYVIQPKVGIGYEIFLQWALNDVAEAGRIASGDECDRASVNAIMNARRALACLVDQYLQRDGFLLCKKPPRSVEDKVAILVARRVLDTLAGQSLERAIKRRNEVEHEYRSIGLSEAQDVVHVVRATIENAVMRASPYHSPALFGSMLGGYGVSEGKPIAWFHGWSEAAFLMITTVQPAWLGIIVPASATEAVVRKVALASLTPDELLEALAIVEARPAGKGFSSCSPNLWHAQLQSAHILV